MGEIRKFRDLPEWDNAKKMLVGELHLDDKTIDLVGEQEGDSLDLVEVCVGLEEGLGSSLKKRRKS
jgi:acyl carrier protein